MVHPGKTALISLYNGQRPSEMGMAKIREYLKSQGATCVENRSGTQTWCQEAFSAPWAAERWTGPKGHDLQFTFSGPNQAGPQLNGWTTKRRSPNESKCPEWALATVDEHFAHFVKLFAAAGKARGYRREQAVSDMRYWGNLSTPDDLGNPEVREAVEASKTLIAEAMKFFEA